MKYKAHTVGAVVLTAGIIHLNNKIGLEIKPLYLIVGAAFGGLLTITLSFFYKMDKEKLLIIWISSDINIRTITG